MTSSANATQWWKLVFRAPWDKKEASLSKLTFGLNILKVWSGLNSWEAKELRFATLMSLTKARKKMNLMSLARYTKNRCKCYRIRVTLSTTLSNRTECVTSLRETQEIHTKKITPRYTRSKLTSALLSHKILWVMFFTLWIKIMWSRTSQGTPATEGCLPLAIWRWKKFRLLTSTQEILILLWWTKSMWSKETRYSTFTTIKRSHSQRVF